ncbi:MAG: DUF5103 domain-containing protein [Bacteroidales bacterium]|nr:DUF5103 domain-containing protein [Bacteroidales bacterium]
MKISKYLSCGIILLCISNFHITYAQEGVHKNIDAANKAADKDIDYTYKSTIHTVQFSREGWPLSYPVLETKDLVPLVLSFDDLDQDPVNYSYTLVHCDSDWEPSNMLKTDYIDGLEEEVIPDYKFSRSSLQNYIHYTLKIPNENMRPTISGNYILKVFEDYDEEKLVLTRRFFLVDHQLDISGEAKRTNNLNYFDSHQEIDFTIHHERLRIDDPLRNIKVVIVQNFDFETAISDLRPTFTAPGELVYDYEEGNIFPGLSEFRHFDTKNLKLITEGINYIRFERPLFNVYLLPDATRSIGDYVYEEDMNGQFYIKWDEGFDANTDADYAIVHFTLPFDAPLTEGGVYLFGGLTDWSRNPRYELSYNFEHKAYELSTPLKQGYYNYQYRYYPEGGQVDPSFFEGAFYETENNYLVFVYFHDFSLRYQQLLGFQVFNTVKKINN